MAPPTRRSARHGGVRPIGPGPTLAASGPAWHDASMFDDPDLPIRLAAFRAVKALTERFGDAVPWEALARGFEHQGRQIALASRPRGIFRPKEMRGGGALSVKTTVPRTGRQARYADLVDPRVGQMDYCFQGEDPLPVNLP